MVKTVVKEVIDLSKKDDCTILGVNIGQYNGWDHVDDFSLQFYDFAPNEIGEKFVPEYEKVGATILFIDFDTGIVIGYKDDVETRMTPDWSVFNKS